MVCRRTAYTVTDAQRAAIVNPVLRAAPKADKPEHWTGLLAEVEAFLRKHPHVSASRLGRDAVSDPQMVFSMRQGRQVGPMRRDKLRAYMAGFDE